jgi:hypothetical protein
MLPTIEIIDEYVMEASAATALREMREDGYVITYDVLKSRIRHLNDAGTRNVAPHDVRRSNNGSVSETIFKFEAERGCEMLLAAQIASDQIMGVPMAAWNLRHRPCL